MKILFAAAHIYLPQFYGGLQTSTDQLCCGLLEKGHKVAVLCTIMPGGLFGWKSRIKMQINKRLSGCKVSKDSVLGYPVWRTWFPWEAIEYVAEKERPDLIVVLTGKIVPLVLAAKLTKIPILAQLHDVAFQEHGGNFNDLGNIPCVATSRFTAEKYQRTYGVNPVAIYPCIPQNKYKTKTTRKNITFVNPYLEKGRNIALEIARLCPDIPFLFVEAWPLPPELRYDLMEKLSSLPNVTLSSPQKDMRKIYRECKILLAPSLWEEAFGRVAAEAQISGIPVVASVRGGLPESVGPGGILLDPDAPIDDWVNAIRKLWRDERYYAELSAKALAHAQRPEMSIAFQINAHERAFLLACGGQRNTG